MFAACLRGAPPPPTPPRRHARGSESLSAWDSSLSLPAASASLSLDTWAALDAAAAARSRGGKGAAAPPGGGADERPPMTTRGSTLVGRSGRLMLEAPQRSLPPSAAPAPVPSSSPFPRDGRVEAGAPHDRPAMTTRGSTLVGRSGRLMLEAPPRSPPPSPAAAPFPSPAPSPLPPSPPPARPAARGGGPPPSPAARPPPSPAARPPPSPRVGPQALVLRGTPGVGGDGGGRGAPYHHPPARGVDGGGDGTANRPRRRSAPPTPTVAPAADGGAKGAVTTVTTRRGSTSSAPPSPSVAPADPAAAAWPTDGRRRSSALRTPSDYDELLAPAAFGRRVTVVGRRSEGFSAAVDGAAARLRRRRADASREAADACLPPGGPSAAAGAGALEASPSSLSPWAAAEVWATPPQPAAVTPVATPPGTSPTASYGSSSVTGSPGASAPSSPAAGGWLSHNDAAAAATPAATPPPALPQGAPPAAAPAGGRFRQAIARRGVSLPGEGVGRLPPPPPPLSPAARELTVAAPAAALAPPADASPDEWLDDYVSFMSEALRVTSTVRAAAAAGGGRSSSCARRRGGGVHAVAGQHPPYHPRRWVWWQRRWGAGKRA